MDDLILLDAEVGEIEYCFTSRLATERAGKDEGGYNDYYFHPAEPRSVRMIVTAEF